jgi:hypothetical protein
MDGRGIDLNRWGSTGRDGSGGPVSCPVSLVVCADWLEGCHVGIGAACTWPPALSRTIEAFNAVRFGYVAIHLAESL